MPRARPRPVACHVRDTVKNNPRAFWCIRISIECSGSAERESATDDANRAATVPRAAPPRPVACHVRDTVKNNPRAFWCIGIECSAERESATMMPTIAIGANSIAAYRTTLSPVTVSCQPAGSRRDTGSVGFFFRRDWSTFPGVFENDGS